MELLGAQAVWLVPQCSQGREAKAQVCEAEGICGTGFREQLYMGTLFNSSDHNSVTVLSNWLLPCSLDAKKNPSKNSPHM